MSDDFCRDFASSLALMILDLNSELQNFAELVDEHADDSLQVSLEGMNVNRPAASTL